MNDFFHIVIFVFLPTQYLKENAVSLCQLIEQQINVKTKEEIATSLIKVLQCLGTANEFLVELVMTETRTISKSHEGMDPR